mgnify:CR=1 FL=1
MILGLDVSTSTTGFCILNNNGTLVELGYIPLAKTKKLVESMYKEDILNFEYEFGK